MKVPNSEWEYHEKEFGRDCDYKIDASTGLVGAAILIATLLISTLYIVGWIPFILLGFGEVVSKSPTQWRCRWRRR